MSHDLTDASLRSITIPPQISPSSDDGLHLFSPSRDTHIHDDDHLVIRHSESSSTPSPTRVWTSAIAPSNQHTVIESHSTTDVRIKGDDYSTVPPKNPTFSISEPLPNWEDFPPLPVSAIAGPFKFQYWWYQLRILFAYEGTRETKNLVRLLWKLGFDLTHICISIVFLIISAKSVSPKSFQITEWAFCNGSLGIWQCLLVARLFCGLGISIWDYQRQRAARVPRVVQSQPLSSPLNPDAEQNATISSIAETRQPDNAADSGHEAVASNDASNTNSTPTEQFRKYLAAFFTLVSVIWWLVAQFYLYFEQQSCRFCCPHLYWLVFGSVCIGYIIALEGVMILFARIAFRISPLISLISLFVNTVRLCLGREPWSPQTGTRPTTWKLSKESVARVPLVFYIPSPNSGTNEEETAETNQSYPPASTSGSPIVSDSKLKHFLSNGGPFLWFQKTSKGQVFNSTAKTASGQKILDEWDTQWEKGIYPFVRIPRSRATCQICLDEFSEPLKKGESKIHHHSTKIREDDAKPPMPQRKSKRKARKANNDDPLKLESIGEGPQPLRLLACGHVFHKSCIDPWLTEVSGRCPTCQMPVEVDGEFHQASQHTQRHQHPAEDCPPSNRGHGDNV